MMTMSNLSFCAWNFCMFWLRLFFAKSSVVQYLDQEVTQHKYLLKAINVAQAESLACLSSKDKALVLSHVRTEHTKEARELYWSYMDPTPYVAFYRKADCDTDEIERLLCEQRASSEFRRRIHSLLMYA